MTASCNVSYADQDFHTGVCYADLIVEDADEIRSAFCISARRFRYRRLSAKDGARAGAVLRSRSVLAEAAAESLGGRLDYRRLRRFAGPCVDHPPSAVGRREFQG